VKDRGKKGRGVVEMYLW